jgi:hypothetical protein
MPELPGEPELIVSCPHCAARVTVSLAAEAREYECWSCRAAFAMPAMTLAPLEEASPDVPEDRRDESADELDGVRIRRLAAERRAAWRSRSHVLIVAGVMAVATGQLVILAAQTLDRGVGAATTFYALGAALALLVTTRLLRRAAAMRRQIEAAARHPDPDAPPDFTPLGDGSQRWRRLEQLKKGDSPPFRGDTD